MQTYICFYNQKQTTVEAESSYDAHQLALAFFKPPKSKRHMVSVHLADVEHSTAGI